MYPARTDTHAIPFWTRAVTLGRAHGGCVTYTHTIGNKEAALAQALTEHEGATYFVAWTGQHTTDIFVVSGADAARWLKERRK